jgi:hypothetical protein
METALVTPSVFRRNRYDHITFSVIGLDRTGAGEIAWLAAAGYRMSGHAEKMFLSKREDGYDTKHRLTAGQEYTVVLLPGKLFANDSQRTTTNVCAKGKEFGYTKSLAGIAPRILAAVSDEQMKEWGFRDITPLHDRIADDDNKDSLSRVFSIVQRPSGLSLWSYRDNADSPWIFEDRAFAFFER